MATYKRSYYEKRKTSVFRIAIAMMALLTFLATIGLGVRFYVLDRNIKKNQVIIASIKKENTELEKQIPSMTQQVETLKIQTEDLKNILWKHEPIVIPESMK